MTSSDRSSPLAALPSGDMGRRVLENVYDWTSGALLLGVFVNTFFFGVTSYQFIVYYSSGLDFSDPWWIKTVVLSLLLIDVFQSCEMLYVPWFLLIKNYNNPGALRTPIWQLVITPIMDSLTAGITQLFLMYRIFQLRRNYYICSAILLLTVTNISLGISTGAFALKLSSLADAYSIPTAIAWLVTQAFTDILISAVLSWIFLRARTGNRGTDWALRTLLRKSLQTGIPAALLAIAILLSYTISGTQSSSMFAALAFPHGRIYTLTLMDTLLVRGTLRRKIRGTDTLVLQNLREDTEHSQPETVTQHADQTNIPLVRVSSLSAFKDCDQYYAPGPSQPSA